MCIRDSPYTAGATTLTSLFPPWTLENGIQGALELLAQPDGRKRLMDDWQVEQADWDNTICSTCLLYTSSILRPSPP